MSAGSGLVQEEADPIALGSLESFEGFYLRERRALIKLAYALSGSRWAAEDLAQEAFLVAHRNWSRIGVYERPDLWVRRVVVNISVSAFRRRAAESKALARLALGQQEVLPDLSTTGMEFWRTVRTLPRRRAQVVVLHYLEDRPVAEIAEILGMAPGTVKKHLHDGRRSLAERLDISEGLDE